MTNFVKIFYLFSNLKNKIGKVSFFVNIIDFWKTWNQIKNSKNVFYLSTLGSNNNVNVNKIDAVLINSQLKNH